jgi:glycosyltransferase involved in cell wall biosynthesis
LEGTIRSVLLQGYPNLEYIVIDGGSTDGSLSVIEKYDPWIDTWVSEPDNGQSHAINKGFERASGDIYAWINSDDYYEPGAFTRVCCHFSDAPGSDVLVGRARKVKPDGETVYVADVPELSKESFLRWRQGGNFLQPACFFRRKAWEACGPLRQDLTYCMDVALWLEMVQSFRFDGVDARLATALAHPEAKTTKETERTAVEVGLLVTEHGGFDVARKDLMAMADRLAELRALVRLIKDNPVYRYVLGPVYRWLKQKPRL